MDKDKKQERIDDYLRGKGSPEERHEFEEETSRDHDLSRELKDTELAIAAIELAEDRALKIRLQQLEQRLAAEKPGATIAPPLTAADSKPQARVVEMRPRGTSKFHLLGYAATLLLVLAAAWWLLARSGGSDAQQLAMDNFTPYQNIVTGTVRGDNDDTAEAAAFAAYDAENYAAAENEFSALPDSVVFRFYLGQSLLAQEKFAAAATIFTSLSQEENFSLAPESAYYGALARLGEGQKEAAKRELEIIATTAGHPMQTEARKTVAEIRD